MYFHVLDMTAITSNDDWIKSRKMIAFTVILFVQKIGLVLE